MHAYIQRQTVFLVRDVISYDRKLAVPNNFYKFQMIVVAALDYFRIAKSWHVSGESIDKWNGMAMMIKSIAIRTVVNGWLLQGSAGRFCGI